MDAMTTGGPVGRPPGPNQRPDIDLFCGIGERTINAGFHLRPDLTRRIGALELTVSVHVY